MGFEDTLVPERLIATFSGFTVFEVRGITITDELSRSVTGIAAGVNYRIGVSASVNSACRAIGDDDFVDAEIEWMKEHQAQGPFALVQIGPTEAYEAEVTHIRRGADGSVTTYDAFASSREEIRRLEQRALPRIAAALACAFNEQDRYVRLKKVARTTVGAYSTPIPPPIPVQTLPAIPDETRHPLHSKPYRPFQSKVGHPFQNKPATQAG